jgi:hypothetical protein
MTQSQINHEACQSLINRAFSSESITVAEFLIQTAYTLDNTINTAKLLQDAKTLWMIREADRRNINVTL